MDVDAQTRCAHWHGPTDVVALRCACCEVFYPCYDCHEATTGRPFTPWLLARMEEPAVLCGVCRTPLAASAYLPAEAGQAASGHACPACGAAFNPGCAAHRDLYFEPLAPEAAPTSPTP